MAISDTIKQWHKMVDEKDLSKLGNFLSEQAVFRSPMAHTPYPGKMAVYGREGIMAFVEKRAPKFS